MTALRHLAHAAVIVAAAMWGTAHAATLDLRISLVTGEVTIENAGLAGVTIDAYSIDSAAGLLLPSNWLSVTDNYDISGDASVDSTSEWLELSNAATSLAEGSLTALSGSVASGGRVELGAIVSDAVLGDLTFTYLAGDQEFTATPTFFVDADLNSDDFVDASDFVLFRDQPANAPFSSLADINFDGTVNAADFFVLQQQFGVTSPFAATSAASTPTIAPLVATALAIPEPASGVALATAMIVLLCQGRRNAGCRIAG